MRGAAGFPSLKGAYLYGCGMRASLHIAHAGVQSGVPRWHVGDARLADRGTCLRVGDAHLQSRCAGLHVGDACVQSDVGARMWEMHACRPTCWLVVGSSHYSSAGTLAATSLKDCYCSVSIFCRVLIRKVSLKGVCH